MNMRMKVRGSHQGARAKTTSIGVSYKMLTVYHLSWRVSREIMVITIFMKYHLISIAVSCRPRAAKVHQLGEWELNRYYKERKIYSAPKSLGYVSQ